ncbi:hypothetical protein MSAN_02015100 [Mycena sanguinolenta]|uniref:Uncharacterized protein n=1 Tax=Mycena sanguinolenta TaxID=230812 RepID=A0A8H6XL12_9AGAR|nr:hypothetical protein MSAN_02015100 [Mycena sanguinolenta]
MSSSVHKDTFNVIMMHKLPPHLSMDEWVAKRESLVNEALSLPVVQKNLVKCEIIIQNELFDDHFKVFGLPKRDPVLFVALRSETAEQLYAILADAEVRRIFERGKEAGSQSYGFSVDIVAKINKQALSNGVNTFFVYNVPPPSVFGAT